MKMVNDMELVTDGWLKQLKIFSFEVQKCEITNWLL